MRTIKELLALSWVLSAHISVWQNQRDIEAAKRRLELALDARDKAIAALHILDGEERVQIPEYLVKRIG